MSAKSSIEWLLGGATWNPLRARNRATGKVGWFCEHVSELCRNCYAESMNLWIGTGLAYEPVNRKNVEIFLDEKILREPLRWKAPRLVFPGSMTDLFADFVTDEMLDRIHAVMALARQHTFLMLTKRPERRRVYLNEPGRLGEAWCLAAGKLIGRDPGPDSGWPLPNVWQGYSGTDDGGVGALRRTPAAVRWLSIEPLLGPVEIAHFFRRPGAKAIDILGRDGYPGIDWVVVGGESGPRARETNIADIRSVVAQCRALSVPVFVKQYGANAWGDCCEAGLPAAFHDNARHPLKLKDKKGGDPSEWPAGDWPREFPEVRS